MDSKRIKALQQQNPPILTPKIQRMRRLGQSLVDQGTSNAPVNHWLQGVARVAQAYVGRKQLDEADKLETQKRLELAEALAGPFNSEGGTGGRYDQLAKAFLGQGDTNSAINLYLKGRPQPQQKPWYASTDETGNTVIDPSYMNMRRDIATAGRPNVSVSTGMNESERSKSYGKHLGEHFGKEFTGMQQASAKANQEDTKLDRLDQLLDQANTGATAGITQPLKRIGKDLGLDLEQLGISDDVSATEAAEALSNQMALELRNPAGGAGMPGALSDKDREFLVSMVPRLQMTHEGRKQLIETRRRLNRRSMDVANLARQYQQKRGMLDDGFYAELEAYSQQNPLFGDIKAPQEQTAGPQPGMIEDGYRFNGGNPADPNSWEKVQ